MEKLKGATTTITYQAQGAARLLGGRQVIQWTSQTFRSTRTGSQAPPVARRADAGGRNAREAEDP